MACPIVGYAITPKALSDSLTQFAQHYANVERIKVKSIQQNQYQIRVYTIGSSLSFISLSPEDIHLLKEKVSQWACGSSNCDVAIYTNNREIESFVTARFQPREEKERFVIPDGVPLTQNISHPYTITQGLNNKHIALWGSHGLCYMQQQQMWKWQRARLWTTVEDLYTTSYLRTFLVPMLENAGAVVIQPRERDVQKEEVIVDDSQIADIDQHIVWESTGNLGWGRYGEMLLDGDNPFHKGTYHRAKLSEEADTLYYVPKMSKEGNYAVYVSYATEAKSTDKAHYTIVHKGEKSEYLVNQQMGGGTWVYLGTFRFDTIAKNNYIALSNQGENSKMVVTADAVKIGGGMGCVARYPHLSNSDYKNIKDSSKLASLEEDNKMLMMTSGYPRFMEGARYWLQYCGIPDSIYSPSKEQNDYTDDFTCRGKWVNYLAGGSAAIPNSKGLNIPINMSLAVHSDAGFHMNEGILGTLAIYTDWDNDGNTTYPAGGSRMCNRDIADWIQTQVVEDIRRTTCQKWTRRRLQNSSYAESRHPKVPSAIIEMLSHQNYADMQYGLNPRFKFIVSRAIYKAILRFIHTMDGTPFVVHPLPIHGFNMGFVNGTDSIELSWQSTLDSIEVSAEPTYYVLYTREEGKDWNEGQVINSTKCRVGLTEGKSYDFRIAAGNEGGISMPSEILSACIMSGSTIKALLINGFTDVRGPEMDAVDSLTGGILPNSHAIAYDNEIAYLGEQFDYNRHHSWISDDDCGFGMCHADHAQEVDAGNTYNYPSMHGRELRRMNISYVSTSIEAVDSLNAYQLVDIILGKQKDEEGCIPLSIRPKIKEYLDNGGNLLMSGSYLASDMLSKKNAQFTQSVLHYKYQASRASQSGRINMAYPVLPRRKYNLITTPNENIIECEAPNGITPLNGAVRIGYYEDNGICAGIAYKNQLIVLPFMLESIKEFDTLYKDCIQYLFEK